MTESQIRILQETIDILRDKYNIPKDVVSESIRESIVKIKKEINK